MKLFVFPTPSDAECILSHDKGWAVNGVADTHPTGRTGKSITIPNDTPNGWGANLVVRSDKMVPINLRGILMFGENDLAYLLCDDFHLQAEKVCPEVPPIPPIPPVEKAQNPLDQINKVYATGKFNLRTKEGCGQFTEECCKQLHENFSENYGHVRKSGAQNQYNGHAVDAINLLRPHHNPDGVDTEPGVYDIIISSESPEAKPAFNFAGPANEALWYYPA